MDILQEYTSHALTLYTTIEPYTRTPLSMASSTLSSLSAQLTPYLNRLVDTLSSSPALVSVGIIILILLTALQVLNYVRRIMMWWFKLVLRLVFWSLVMGIAAVVYQRGVGRTVDDLVSFWGTVRGVWWEEYRKWEGYNNSARPSGVGYNGSGGGKGGGRFGTGNLGGQRGYGHR